jgi:hypothetical protein
MKRSEMILNIAIEMMGRLPEWEKQERLNFAEEVLQVLEINGMLPPKDNEDWLDWVEHEVEKEHKENHGYGITAKRRHYAIRGAILAIKTTWDNEDEEK